MNATPLIDNGAWQGKLFRGCGISGNGSRVGGPANWEEFTQWQWVTVRGAPPGYPI